jgi:hypothetical protein
MSKPAAGIIAFGAVALLCCLAAHAGAPSETTVAVQPDDTGDALVNPAMGWTLHFYSNHIDHYGSKLEPSDTLDDFPGLSVVYLRVPWSFLEPEEGRFDWSLLDTPAQRWIDRGKQIALRISCSESWMRYATPEWVRAAGAAGYDFTPGQGAHEGGVFWEPDFADPVFLDKLDGFLEALAQRYDGNDNVAFVDVGSYGVWGEGHTFHSSRKTYDDATKRKHVDLHLKHFKETLLALNDDYVGNDVRAGRAPLTDYALSRGLTLRDDSILVQPPPKSWYHAELAQPFWPRRPVILEHEHFGPSKQKGAWDGALLLQAVEDYHASYLSIHWWPREFLEQNRDTIRQINLRLGYRLQLREARWPAKVALGQPIRVTMQWANAGVAPCYPGGYPAVTLEDHQGGIVAVHVDESFDMRRLPVGPQDAAPVETLESTFVVARRYVDGPRVFARAVQPGTYDLLISVGSRDGTPEIALPLRNDDGRGRYRLGQIELTDAAP